MIRPRTRACGCCPALVDCATALRFVVAVGTLLGAAVVHQLECAEPVHPPARLVGGLAEALHADAHPESVGGADGDADGGAVAASVCHSHAELRQEEERGRDRSGGRYSAFRPKPQRRCNTRRCNAVATSLLRRASRAHIGSDRALRSGCSPRRWRARSTCRSCWRPNQCAAMNSACAVASVRAAAVCISPAL